MGPREGAEVQVGEVVAEMEVGAVGEEEAEAEGFSSKLCLEEVDGSESLAQQFLQLGLPKTVEVSEHVGNLVF